MKHRSLNNILIVSVLGLILAACGGGGGAGRNILTGTGGGSGSDTPSLVISLLDTSGNSTNSVNGKEVVNIRAELRSSSGAPIANVTVTFSTSKGHLNPADGTALTDSEGIATVQVSADITAGAGSITAFATVNGVTVTSDAVDFQTDGLGTNQAPSAFSIALSLSSNAISNLNPATAEATITDADGTPLRDVVVEFSVSLGKTNPASGSTLTDADGVARVQILSNGSSGSSVLSATLIVGEQSISADPINYVTIFDPASLSLRFVDQQTGLEVTTINGDVAVLVEALLLDGAGIPVPENIVNFTIVLGELSEFSALTSTAGVAQVQLTAGDTPGAGTLTASAEFEGLTISSSKPFSTDGLQDQPFAGNIQLVLDPGTISSTSPGMVTLSVTDRNGVAVPNIIVEFFTTLGSLEPSSGSVHTDALGRASVNLVASSNTGKGSLSAQININDSIVLAEPVGFIVANLQFDVSLSDLVVDGNESVTATATLLDLDGIAIPDVVVSFLSVQGQVERMDSAITGSDGKASVTIRGSGVAGEGVVSAKATINFVEVSDTAVFQGTDITPSLELTLSSNSISDGENTTITATLIDIDGSPIVGETVTFSASLGTLATTTVLTNNAGIANSVVTAGALTGVGLITASATVNVIASSNTVSFTIGAAVPTHTLTITTIDGVLDGNEQQLVLATLADLEGTAVPDVTVVFTSTLGQFVDNIESDVTDPSGIAEVTLRGDAVAGEGIITATATVNGTSVSDTESFQSSRVQPTLGLSLASSNIGTDEVVAVTARLLDFDGVRVLSNQIVNFTATLGDLDKSSALTVLGTGIATVNLTGNAIAGTGVVTATTTFNGFTLTDSANYTSGGVDPTLPVLTIQSISDADSDGLVEGNELVTVVTRLVDANGVARAGQVVTMTTSVGTLVTASDSTDINGTATLTFRGDAAAGEGTITVTASVAGKSVSETGTFQSVSSAPAIAITPIGDVIAAEVVTVKATLTDFNGSVLVGKIVTFSTTAGNLNKSSAVTDGFGVATVTLTGDDSIGLGIITASATINSIAISDTEDFNNTGDIPTITLVLSSSEIGIGETVTVTGTLRDANGGLITTGEVLTFSTTLGSLDSAAGATVAGVASVNLTGAAIAGLGIVSASTVVNGVAVTGSTNFEQVVPELTLVLSSNANPAGCPFAPDNTTCAADFVTATVTILEGTDPVDNAIVSYSITQGLGVLSSAQALTGATGIAQINIGPGKAPGFDEITATATVKGVTTSDSQTFRTLGDAPLDGEGTVNLNIDLKLVRIDGGVTTDITQNPVLDARIAGTTKLQATVTNHDGSNAADILVQFESVGFGTLAPANGLVLSGSTGATDEGIAFINFAAGSAPGAGIASVSIIISGQKFNTVSIPFTTLGNGGIDPVTIGLDFSDSSPTVATNVITSADSGTLTIRLTNAASEPLSNRKISVSTSSGASLSGLVGGEVDSDAFGEAIVGVAVGTMAPQTTGSIVVVVDTSTQLVQFEVGFDVVNISSVTLTPSNTASETISARGTTQVTATVTSGAVPVPQAGVSVSFSSECVDLGLANIGASATTDALGQATVTYQDNGCSSGSDDTVDTITAIESASGQSNSSAQVTVLAPALGFITFDTIEIEGAVGPNQIFIREAGGVDTATVIFKVFDEFGLPKADERVEFELTNTTAGMTLIRNSGLSDADGIVKTTVQAGFLPGTVSVVASVTRLDGTVLNTVSSALTVNTGIPDQNSMSMSATILNIEGGDFDGVETEITVRLADALNNPVADDTSVEFTTEYGAIVASCQTVLGLGSCSVILSSQDPRDSLNPDSLNKNVFDDGCPTAQVFQESVLVQGSLAADTNYLVASVQAVQIGAAFVSGSEYTVDSDGSGITCSAAPDNCDSGDTLLITYTRQWLDESVPTVSELIPGSAQTHTIDSPGTATAPFTNFTGIPCDAASRISSSSAGAYLGGLGQPYGGRSMVLAFTQGEEGFIDADGNGRYDTDFVDNDGDGVFDPTAGDTLILLVDLDGDGNFDPGDDTLQNPEVFNDLPEVFLDKNEDGVYGNAPDDGLLLKDTAVRTVDDPITPELEDRCYGPTFPTGPSSEQTTRCYQVGGDEEVFIDFGDNTDPADFQLFNLGNGIYNGSLCPPAFESVGVCTRDLVNIRRSLPILFSGSGPVVAFRSSGELIRAVDLRFNCAPVAVAGSSSVCFTASRSLTATDGTTRAAGALFTVGYVEGATVVFPKVSEREGIFLTGSSGSVTIHVSDSANGLLPSLTTIVAAPETGGCVPLTAPGSPIVNSNDFGFTKTGMSLAADPAGADAGVAHSVNVTISPVLGNSTQTSLSCTY